MNHRAIRMIFLSIFVLMVVALLVGTLVPGSGRWLPFHAPVLTHVLLFTVLGALTRLAMPETRWALLKSVALAACLGIALETMQLAVPGRSFTIVDLFTNLGSSVAGVVLSALVLAVLARTGSVGRGNGQAGDNKPSDQS